MRLRVCWIPAASTRKGRKRMSKPPAMPCSERRHRAAHFACWSVVGFLIATSGCSSFHAAQRCDERWSRLHEGMSKIEVTEVLGKPQAISGPLEVQSNPSNSAIENVVGGMVLKAAFDGWFERWEYGHFGLMENFLTPSERAFIVYFGSDGKVV